MMIDTTAEASQVRLKALRSLTGEERLTQALRLSESVMELAKTGATARRKAKSEAA
jgi:hypothetical protein